jgi:nucleotide-binding universal stress UspA family protein
MEESKGGSNPQATLPADRKSKLRARQKIGELSQIVEVVRTHNIDLIIIATRGYTGLKFGGELASVF